MAPRLTPKEKAALEAVASGLIERAIARQLGISPRSYRRRINNVQVKLGAVNTANAIAIAASAGLITVLPQRQPPCYDGAPARDPGRWNSVRNNRADAELARRNGI
jgi:DNA-binding CsgD family transcriptional regulator